jgi:tRNA(His) 5'-end guanylyltransferase
MDKTQIADRMKDNYEKRARTYLTRRTPVICRLDGKCFHSITKGMDRPFDENLNAMMRATTIKLCEEIQGAKCAYMQSDEISILITDYDKLTTDAWFDYGIQKMCSVSASIATAEFNHYYSSIYNSSKTAYFDSRVFNIPREEVNNYFVWRSMDWKRNSIQLAGQSVFSHSKMHKKNTNDIKQMLWDEHQITWEDYKDKWKNGNFCVKTENGWEFLNEAPIFSKEPNVIDNLVNCDMEE